jgi:hypothetical protein
LYDRYVAAQSDSSDPEHGWAGVLKYYQYLVRAVMSDPEYGIGAEGNARGLLIFHLMGMGKTRLAVAVAMALWDVRPVVVMLPRSLRANFRETVSEVVGLLNAGASPMEIARRAAEAWLPTSRVLRTNCPTQRLPCARSGATPMPTPNGCSQHMSRTIP